MSIKQTSTCRAANMGCATSISSTQSPDISYSYKTIPRLAYTPREVAFVASIIISLGLFGNVAWAAPPATVETLTGGTVREWIIKRVELVMGPSHRCTAGERYFFQANGKVRIERCNAGTLQHLEREWKFEVNPGSDPVILIGDTRYLAHFYTQDETTFLRLRVQAAIQSQPTVDRILKYESD